MFLRSLGAAVCLLAAPALLSPLSAQLQPPTTGGLAALDQQLRTLGQYKRVLMIGAHPDDEDTELLTVLVRGMGASAAYLSLNRGEGGQNLIGEELGEALGLLRSEELLAARQLDGAQQFFTRAYDFGFSKSLDDTWAHWPRDSVLKDVVRIVRRFRPQVVVSVFSGTPRDGHGQHQAAGWAAREAFDAAGDSTRFPELATEEGLAPWRPLKLYRSARFDSAATTVTIQGGVLDPAVGQSFHQIAMRGRSLHRSQDMGQLQGMGPSPLRLALWNDRTGHGEGGVFAGIDTSLAATPAALAVAGSKRESLRAILQRYTGKILEARKAVSPGTAAQIPGLLASAAAELESAAQISGSATDLEGEADRLASVLGRSSALLVDAVTDDSDLIAGQEVRVSASVWNPGTEDRRVGLCVASPASGWRLQVDSQTAVPLPATDNRPCLRYSGSSWRPGSADSGSLAGGALAIARLRLTVPENWQPTAPYFLRQPREGDLYRWDPADRASWGLPFESPLLLVEAQVPGGQSMGRISREVSFRSNDQARGELRTPLIVVPRIDVKLEPGTEVWPLGAATRQFQVTLTHAARDSTSGQVKLQVPAGWSAPPTQRFRFTREAEHATFMFNLRVPAGARAGRYQLWAVAEDDAGRAYSVGRYEVTYPHIRSRSYTRPAESTVQLASLTLPQVGNVAYIRGAADRIPEALSSVGVRVAVITGKDLVREDLSRFRILVVGPRAYETDPDLPANNDELLAFARQGGLVLVQYQQYGFFLNGYAPFPMTVGSRAPGTATGATTTRPGSSSVGGTALLGGHDRVTDETAAVTLLKPGQEVLVRPNRIVPADWEGWVQERGLYFAHSWDSTYKSVLAMHDPGEAPLEGGLLIAPLGKGRYVYTGLSFFRQLPAGVPGAFRLFANLLALADSASLSSVRN